MAPIDDDSIIVIPVKSSLLKLASVAVAMPLFNKFAIKTLNLVFKEIQVKDSSTLNKASQENYNVNNKREKENKAIKEIMFGDSSALNEACQGSCEVNSNKAKRNKVLKEIEVGDSSALNEARLENWEVNGAKESILFIPNHLRTSVLRAVNGIQYAVTYWRRNHWRILDTKDDRSHFYWKSDGTIDLVKTAQQLVLNKNIDITVRFKMACMYGFQEIMQSLKAEMEVSGKLQHLETDDRSMTSVGARWLRAGCQVPWSQAIREYLDPRACCVPPIPRFSSFFPLLRPEDREKFLSCLAYTTLDDIRICLCSVTKKEYERILKMHSLVLLILHLYWPMQNLFLENAAKLCKYMTCRDYKILMCILLALNCGHKDFDYGELFGRFWDNSPIHLRESAKQCQALKKHIDAYMNEKYKARARADTEQIEKRKVVLLRRNILPRKCKKSRCL